MVTSRNAVVLYDVPELYEARKFDLHVCGLLRMQVTRDYDDRVQFFISVETGACHLVFQMVTNDRDVNEWH